jgi:hypothetical protein
VAHANSSAGAAPPVLDARQRAGAAIAQGNGNNTNFTYINSQNNLNLSCIQVDDVTYSTANWTGSNFIFGSQTSFSEDCLTVGLEESESIILTAYPNPTSGLFLSQPSNGQVLDLSGRSLMSFSNVRTIDLNGLASGSYLLRTVDGNVMRVVRE